MTTDERPMPAGYRRLREDEAFTPADGRDYRRWCRSCTDYHGGASPSEGREGVIVKDIAPECHYLDIEGNAIPIPDPPAGFTLAGGDEVLQNGAEFCVFKDGTWGERIACGATCQALALLRTDGGQALAIDRRTLILPPEIIRDLRANPTAPHVEGMIRAHLRKLVPKDKFQEGADAVLDWLAGNVTEVPPPPLVTIEELADENPDYEEDNESDVTVVFRVPQSVTETHYRTDIVRMEIDVPRSVLSDGPDAVEEYIERNRREAAELDRDYGETNGDGDDAHGNLDFREIQLSDDVGQLCEDNGY